MGCRQSLSTFDKKTAENEKIEKFEESFGFRQNDCSFYEGILSRLSNSSQSSSQAFDSFSKFSKIPLSDELKASLLSNFSKAEKIELRAFRCFCILLSKSPELDKGEALWYTFDATLQDCLPETDIKLMMKSLIKGSVSVALDLAIQTKYYDESKLKTWRNYLKEREESLEIKLVKHFVQGKEVVSKEEFMLRLQDRPEGLITTPAAIRFQLERTQVIPNKFANPFKNMKVTKLTG